VKLRQELIRTAHEVPETRAAIVPLLRELSKKIAALDPIRVLEGVGRAFKRKYGFLYEIDEDQAPDEYYVSIWDPNDEPAYAPTLSIMIEPGYGYMIMAGRHSQHFRRDPNPRKLLNQAFEAARGVRMITGRARRQASNRYYFTVLGSGMDDTWTAQNRLKEIVEKKLGWKNVEVHNERG